MLNISKKIINIIFLVIMISLFVMSIFVHCEMNIYSYTQALSIEHHRIIVYLILICISVVLILIFYGLTNRLVLKVKNPQKAVNMVTVVCSFIIFAAGVFWINFNDCVPKYDQSIIYEEARKLAGYFHEPFDNKYMSFYKRQRAFTMLMAAALRIFGDAQTSVGILNVFGAVAVFAGISKTVDSLVKDKEYIVFLSVIITLFYPLIVYTAFMYGTLLSLTLHESIVMFVRN